jgi:predicted metal-dependent HD superfamily phosphohydrolase
LTTWRRAVRERWTQLCGRIGRGGDAGTLFLLLQALYAHPPRAYHSLDHIGACLGLVDEVRALAAAPDEVEFALWLHDGVYEPMAKDNEARSAAVAAVFARDLQCPRGFSERVAALIDATRHTGAPPSGDAALVADVDMAVLGSDPPAYDAYAGAIRREYAAASDPGYRRGRAAFLEALLGRPAIYHLPPLRSRFEAAARGNLSREIRALHS